MKLIKIAYRNVFRNKKRSLLSGSAVAVGAMTIVFLFALIEGMRLDMETNLVNFFNGEIRIRDRDYEKYEKYNPLHLNIIWDEIEPFLIQHEDIKAYSPRVVFSSSLYINEKMHPAIAFGIDFALEAKYQKLDDILYEGRLPSDNENELLVSLALAKNLNLKIGDKITLLSTTAERSTNAITLSIVGLANFGVDSMKQPITWLPLQRAQHFLKMEARVTEILLKVNGNRTLVTEKLRTQLDDRDYEIKSLQESDIIYDMMEMVQSVYYMIALFFFLLGSTVIVNTTVMVVYERIREIGTLRALGMHNRLLTTLFLLEGVIISSVGAFVGVVVGSGVSLLFNRIGINFTQALSGVDMNISNIIYPVLDLKTPVIVFVYAVCVSALATLIPSTKAAKIEVVEALKYV
ncbi:MAG: FtsX-like permease family protein [Sphaerochaetaceae bacterium]